MNKQQQKWAKDDGTIDEGKMTSISEREIEAQPRKETPEKQATNTARMGKEGETPPKI
jgi:hypothetical protein